MKVSPQNETRPRVPSRAVTRHPLSWRIVTIAIGVSGLLLTTGCFPNGTKISEHDTARWGDRMIVERCSTKTMFILLTPEGPQHNRPRSRIWSYWIEDTHGKRKELEFLRRPRIEFGVGIMPLPNSAYCIAIDVQRSREAIVILFSDTQILDQRPVHFDYLDDNEPWKIMATGRLRFVDNGSVREFAFSSGAMKEVQPLEAPVYAVTGKRVPGSRDWHEVK
jgi:hypothetical protein